MSVLIFNEGERVISNNQEYIYIRKAGQYHYVENPKTKQKVYKIDLTKVIKSAPKEIIKETKSDDVFLDAAIDDHNITVYKKQNIEELINKVNNMKWEELVTNIPDEHIDLIVTDPPYGMSWKSNRRKDVTKRHDKIANDDNLDWLPELVKQSHRVLKTGSHIYVFCSHHFIEVFKSEFSKKFEYKHTLIWDKKQGNLGDLKGNYSTYTEFCLFLTKGKGKNLNGGRDSNILRKGRTKNHLHPTEKPAELMRYLIEKSSMPDDLVCDFFMGSWATAKGCKLSGRNFIGSELEKKYCDDAEELINLTNKELF